MTTKSKGTAWAVIAFALPTAFIVFMLGMILYASLQDVQLVEEGYYEKGLAYQDKIDRIRHAQDLDTGLTIEHRYTEQLIVLTTPDSTRTVSGTVRIIRPSNARYDRQVGLEPDAGGRQTIETTGMMRGLWRLEVDWSMDSVRYYDETRIVIP